MWEKKGKNVVKNGSIAFEIEAGKAEKVSNETDVTVLGEKTKTIQKVTFVIVPVVLLGNFYTTKNAVCTYCQSLECKWQKNRPPSKE